LDHGWLVQDFLSVETHICDVLQQLLLGLVHPSNEMLGRSAFGGAAENTF
jgi:hypothetical protein